MLCLSYYLAMESMLWRKENICFYNDFSGSFSYSLSLASITSSGKSCQVCKHIEKENEIK